MMPADRPTKSPLTAMLAEAQKRGAECVYTRKPVTCDDRGTEYDPLNLYEWCGACFIRVMRAAYWQQSEELARVRAELDSALHCQQAEELVRLRHELETAQREIIEAREACSAVRMQRFFDAPLLTLVNETVSQLFGMQSSAEAAEAEIACLRAELDALKVQQAEEIARLKSVIKMEAQVYRRVSAERDRLREELDALKVGG